jgi:transposase
MARTLTRKGALVVEMTTNTWQIYDRLVERVHSVTVVHPPHVKLIAQVPVMNDKKAAEALAILLGAGLLHSVWVPDAVVRDRRQLVAQRQDRVRAATQAENRMHAILFRHQMDKPEASQPFSVKQRDFWRSLPVSPVEKLAIDLDLATLDLAESQRAQLETFITQEALTDARMPFLLQIPGLSVLGALTILAAIGYIERFPTAKKLVGYAGLGARVHDSGQTRSTGKRAAAICAASGSMPHRPLPAVTTSGRLNWPAWSRVWGATRPWSPSPANCWSWSGMCSPSARLTPARRRSTSRGTYAEPRLQRRGRPPPAGRPDGRRVCTEQPGPTGLGQGLAAHKA